MRTIMRIFKTLLLLVVAVPIIQGHPLLTSAVQDDKSPLSLAESLVKKTEEKIPETDSLKTDSLKSDLLKPDHKPDDLLLKKQTSVEEPERKEEPKPETSSETKPKPEYESKPSSSSSSSMTEQQAPCSSTTYQDCGSVPKPETSSEMKPKPEDDNVPSSSSPSTMEPQSPGSSSTDQDCGSAPKPETSSEMKPKPEDDNVPSSSSPSTMEPQSPGSSSTDQDCGSAPKPGNYVDRRQYDYDQRQNGTENYRIQVDGLVLVLAPVEALLLAGGMGSEMMNGQFNFSSALDQPITKDDENQSSNISSKPEFEKPSLHKSVKPTVYASPKPADGPVSIKLINLIAPLLEQRRH